MRKLMTLMTLLCLSIWTNAEKVKIDGIWYELESTGKTAEVTSADDGTKYDGGVVIPETVTHGNVVYNVTSIGGSAFHYCSNLTSITIGNSVTSIGEWAFNKCSNLTSITIPNSVTSIGNGAFFDCFSLTSITIPNSVKSIGVDAFGNCSSLASITIPNSVTNIISNAFRGCPGLISIVVEKGNTVYDSRENCNAIIKTATNTLISGCQSTVIPNSVATIGNYAFSRCSSLTSITIPNSVTYIGWSAFSGCSGLTSITIGNSVTSIGRDAFGNCSSLTSITISNSVTSIGEWAFDKCTNLTNITIPNSVKSIGNKAFSGCEKLTDVYCYAEKVPSTGNYVFSDSLIEYATLHVPESAIEDYKTTVPWSGFGTIVALTDKDPSVVNVPHMNEQPFSVHSQNGTVTVSGGLTDGTAITVYSTSGMTMGSATTEGGRASVSTSLQAGDVAIVNIGSKQIKVVMK